MNKNELPCKNCKHKKLWINKCKKAIDVLIYYAGRKKPIDECAVYQSKRWKLWLK